MSVSASDLRARRKMGCGVPLPMPSIWRFCWPRSRLPKVTGALGGAASSTCGPASGPAGDGGVVSAGVGWASARPADAASASAAAVVLRVMVVAFRWVGPVPGLAWRFAGLFVGGVTRFERRTLVGGAYCIERAAGVA